MGTQGGFLITRIKQVGGRVFERILAEKKIDAFNGAQGRILYVLWQKDGVPISDLSKETGLALTTLTSMLDRMEAASLIRRDRGDKDRRKILIYLTDEAKSLEKDYQEVTEEISNIYYTPQSACQCGRAAVVACQMRKEANVCMYQGSDPEHESGHRLHCWVRLLLRTE